MKIAVGTVLVLETGEYSDYTFNGPFKVLKEFDQKQLVEEFRAQWIKPQDWMDEPDTHEFIGWLNKNGYVEEIESVSWHIGSYGSFDPTIQATPEEIEAAKELERAIKREAYSNHMMRSVQEVERNQKPWIRKED